MAHGSSRLACFTLRVRELVSMRPQWLRSLDGISAMTFSGGQCETDMISHAKTHCWPRLNGRGTAIACSKLRLWMNPRPRGGFTQWPRLTPCLCGEIYGMTSAAWMSVLMLPAADLSTSIPIFEQ